MPRIKIIKAPKSKVRITGIPKAALGFETTETTTMAPGIPPTISFDSSKLNDMAPPEMTSEEMLQGAQDKNYQNWMQKPQNQMSQFSWAQPFQQKFDLNPQFDASKQYNIKGNEIEPKNPFGKSFSNTMNKAGNIANKISNIIGIGGALGDFITNQEDIKKNEAWKRRQLNRHPVVGIRDMGDYVTNTGDFRPSDKVTTPGMYNNKFYGQYSQGKYGGQPHYASGGGFESVITPDVIPTYSVNSPVISPSLANLPAPVTSSSNRPNIAVKGTDIATRTNNPGNLLYKPVFGKLFGAVDSGIKQLNSSGTFAAFPNVEAGLNAREAQMFGAVDGTFNTKIYKPTITVDEALRKWSNNGYGGNLYPEIANKTLAEVTPKERKELLKRQIKAESGSMYKQLTEQGLLKYGGENNNTNMKIRIVDTPDENHMAEGGQPKYSGQSNYGLYIGQRDLYRTMGTNPYQNAGDTVKEEEDSESPYVLEAEGGETILRPDGTHMKINGPRHTNGGVKLNEEQAPEGSFIFSDTKKMRIGGPILVNFGKSKNDKNKYTPAELAKQYDVNKYRAILEDPNADDLSKDTAKIMVENYEKKLSELSLVQEGMKGFPQGIPKIAEGLVGQQQGQQQKENMAKVAYGGYFAAGGERCPDGYEWVPSPDGEGGECVPLPGGYIPSRGSYFSAPTYGNSKPVGLNFNLNNDDTKNSYNIGAGATGQLQNGRLNSLGYNTSLNFPRLFGKNKGVAITGDYGAGNLNIGANTNFPFLKGNLNIKGGYMQNFNNAGEDENSEGIMYNVPSNKPKSNVNAEVKWKGKVGKTNLTLGANYGNVANYGNPGMAYGGPLDKFVNSKLPKALEGMDVDDGDPNKKYKIKDRDVNAQFVMAPPTGYKQYDPNLYPELYWKQGQAGSTIPGAKIGPATGGGAPSSGWEKAIIQKLQSGVSPEELLKNKYIGPEGVKKYGKYYVPKTTAGTEDKFVYTEQPAVPEIPGQPTPQSSGQETTKEEPSSQLIPGAANPYYNQKVRAGNPPFFSYDLFIAPQREQVFAASKRNVVPRPVFYDPTRELAESSGLAKTIAAGYQGPVQGYSTANIAAQMNAAENAGNILGKYNNLNVGVGNEFAKLQSGLINEEEAYNADRADKLFFNTEQAKKAYRSNLAKYLGKAGQLRKNDYALNTNVGAMNAMHPYFNFNFGPRGMNISQKPGIDWYGMVTGRATGASQQGSVPAAHQYLKAINDLKGQYLNASPAQINRAYAMMYPTAGKTTGMGGGKAAAAYANQAMSMMPYATNNGMYSQGYDIGDLYDQD